MIKYILLPIWWALRFFIYFPTCYGAIGLVLLLETLWDYKQYRKWADPENWEYTPGKEWEEDVALCRYYKSPWHYLLGFRPYKTRKTWPLQS